MKRAYASQPKHPAADAPEQVDRNVHTSTSPGGEIRGQIRDDKDK